MWNWPAILGAGDGFDSELVYVIAVLILAGIGAIADKLRQKMSGPTRAPGKPPTREVPRSEIEVEAPPRRPPPLITPPVPPRAQTPRQAPRPPVVWEAPQPRQPQRPAVPARPRPVARRPAPPAPPAEDRRALAEPVSMPVEPTPAASVVPRVAPTVAAAPERISAIPVGVAVARQEDRMVSDRDVGRLAGRPAQEPGIRHPGAEWLALSPADLPRAVIWSELLSPPIALREQDRLF